MSALMDGAASVFEVRKLLQSLQSGSDRQALRLEWARLHAASAAMRGEPSERDAALSTGFADRVALALAEENAKPAATARWGRAVAGLGVAASVASAVVLGARLFLADPTVPALEVVEEQGRAPVTPSAAPAEAPPAAIAAMPVAPSAVASPVGLNARDGASLDPLDSVIDRAAPAAQFGSSVRDQ